MEEGDGEEGGMKNITPKIKNRVTECSEELCYSEVTERIERGPPAPAIRKSPLI